MSKPFFLGSVVICGIVNILLTLFVTAAAGKVEPGTVWPLFSLLLFLSLLTMATTMAYLVVVCAIMGYKAWASIQDGNAHTTPGKAVGFMFIPFFNFYWVFQAVWGFAKDYNIYIERNRYDTEKLPEGLFLASAVMAVAHIIVGWIPFINILYFVAFLIVLAIIVAKVCDAVNAISTFKKLQASKSIVEETGISKILTPKKLLTKIILCLVALVVVMFVMFVCSLVGTQKISLSTAFSEPHDTPGQNADYDIYMGVRIPRIILAALVGAALAASGVALQAILRNPLAEPYILGISSGAALGVMTAAIAGVSWSFLGGSPMAAMAFLFALGTVWLVWFTGHLAGGSTVTSLLLAGVVINAFFSAVIMLMTSLIDSEQLRSTIMWLMGSIGEKDFSTLLVSAIFIIAGIAGLFTISQKLNVLTLGSQEARSLGVNPRKITLIAFALASFITAVAVGLSGLVGFVGLVVPHSVRLVFGPDHRLTLPASALIGAGFVVICDTIARTIISPAQLPVGVITAIIGGPVFLILLSRYSKKVGNLR